MRRNWLFHVFKVSDSPENTCKLFDASLWFVTRVKKVLHFFVGTGWGGKVIAEVGIHSRWIYKNFLMRFLPASRLFHHQFAIITHKSCCDSKGKREREKESVWERIRQFVTRFMITMAVVLAKRNWNVDEAVKAHKHRVRKSEIVFQIATTKTSEKKNIEGEWESQRESTSTLLSPGIKRTSCLPHQISIHSSVKRNCRHPP